MLSRLRPHLTYANVMATFAVFLALGGGVAWALANNTVKSKHIVNGQVKAVDIADGSDAPVGDRDAVNAARFGDELPEHYARSSVPITDPNAFSMRYQSRYLETQLTGSSFTFGSGLIIENVGIADKFRVCATAGGALAASVYVGGTRTQVSVPADSCSSDFTIPDDGDFSVSGARAQVFGVFSGNGEDEYVLCGLETG